jgi:hypothetical protein
MTLPSEVVHGGDPFFGSFREPEGQIDPRVFEVAQIAFTDDLFDHGSKTPTYSGECIVTGESRKIKLEQDVSENLLPDENRIDKGR